MTFKTILLVTGTEPANNDLKLAAGLCEEVGAHLSVLVLAMAAPPPVGAYGAVVSDSWLQERQADEEQLDKRVEAVRSFVADRALSADVTGQYVEMAAGASAVAERARYADLTLAGPDLLATGTLKEKTIDGALFSSGKPLLLVPANSNATLKPKRIMVAWDARIEAARAVHEARPLIAAADDVHLALVDPIADAYHQGAEPGADAAAYLARHGAKITVDRLPSGGRSVVEVLRRHAIDTSAEMIVMGGYGHSRLREWIFGGVTKSILSDPPLPVLMAR
ncbi:MAG: universal stress protein [Alphaproteobacteria bacterium]|nr:universal stress protein [Alphaproteobacteria bacterium]MBU0802377.1 universal stress protein [Alphaproteobacteria bacterium]MBU0870181.1 universal stress protein [Alphaproteobacteria bacterium]MBU1399876.1 universal stress protein [Alphaproteobacteria bacterium]MBU1590262.1 universal stress protein [Alphaproteobacteria bacterium]